MENKTPEIKVDQHHELKTWLRSQIDENDNKATTKETDSAYYIGKASAFNDALLKLEKYASNAQPSHPSLGEDVKVLESVIDAFEIKKTINDEGYGDLNLPKWLSSEQAESLKSLSKLIDRLPTKKVGVQTSASRCQCGHLQSEHRPIDANDYSSGRCTIGECRCSHFIKTAKYDKPNPAKD
jgi:hypothetical protein